jgi:metallophosphoesterase (TIGR00282 family)
MADKLVEQARKRTKYIFVDFHAEVTSEKQAMAWYLDGRVSAVVGTHTHVQTADERVLPQGTGFLCDVGMCGPSNGILGMEREAVIKKFLTQLPVRFEVAPDPAQLNAVLITLDKATGNAKKLERIRIDADHPFME